MAARGRRPLRRIMGKSTKIQVFAPVEWLSELAFQNGAEIIWKSRQFSCAEAIPQLPPSDRFPLGLAPAFEDGNVCLFGAEAICKYLLGQNSAYLPQNPEMDQWIGWAECNLLPNVLSYVLPSVSAAKIDSNTLELAKKELLAQLSIFNQILLHKTFLVGERLSLADISAAANLLPAYQHVLGDAARSELENVNRWFQTPSTFNEKEHGKIVGVGKPAKKEKEAKQEKPKSAEKEKQPKKKAKEEAEEEMDAAEQAIADQPKFTDPLAALPPATKAIPYFWENFDPFHYSIWFSEYKYPNELKLTYMSCNLIGGMFQRLEKLKKNAFASVCLFGTDNNSTISGVWIWRGHQLAFDLSQDWQVDYESYDWKKLDPNDENSKKMVNEYLMWEGDFGGKKFNQGKIFK
uniref:Elongation factor 1-gamma n=1 Tax=Globodera rostochiensis TaxID=31243 RepID=A0A914HK53_GLORO